MNELDSYISDLYMPISSFIIHNKMISRVGKQGYPKRTGVEYFLGME